MSERKCFLKSVDNSHPAIELKHGEEKLFGRGPESGIHETRCSRKQVKIVPDCQKREAKVTQLGRNPCGVNGMSLTKGHTVTLKEGDRLELLMGQFVYMVEFESPPGEQEGTKVWKRRGLASSEARRRKKRMLSESDEEEGGDQPEEVLENDEEEERDEGEEGGNAAEEDDEDNQPLRPRSRKISDSDDSVEISNDLWELADQGKLLVYTHPEVKGSAEIAAYDLDGTLIGTKSGGVFPKHKDDWKLLYPCVATKLREMHEKNLKIVVFTNQSRLSTKKTNQSEFKSKIENIQKEIGVPMQVFIATGHSFYRKPAIGMWEALTERNDGVGINVSRSFFCGDAAGREATATQKKDFSHCDLLFAKNLGLRFETPEHHFLKKEMPVLKTNVFDPNSIPCDLPLCNPSWGQIISNRTELIVLVGSPGSGKSHFVKTHLIPAGYVHVNRDTLGSWNRCVSVMETALRSRQKVVVDNTNPDVESRRRYITVAKNYTPLVRCFIMDTSPAHARHNNKFRQLTDPSHSIVTDVVLNTYNAKYKEPTVEEGFTEILRINFWPTFKDPNHEKIYMLFLLEK